MKIDIPGSTHACAVIIEFLDAEIHACVSAHVAVRSMKVV